MVGRLRGLLSHLSPSERRILGFLVGWALVGAVADRLPWTASLAGPARVVIPPNDARAQLHAKSAALAAHLASARTPPVEPLDPNQAAREELDRLPGVGPLTARRWIEERERGGPFFALPDLGRIRGLGPARLAKMARYLRFPPVAKGPEASRSGAVNLNRASEIELATLPGVGPVLAARIVQHRRLRGRIPSLAALDSVPGVGPALLERLRERVVFEEIANGCCRMRHPARGKD